MQVERYWILAAKQLTAQATEAELDELAGYTNLQAQIRLLTVAFNNMQPAKPLAAKDAAKLLQRIQFINSYTNLHFTGEPNH